MSSAKFIIWNNYEKIIRNTFLNAMVSVSVWWANTRTVFLIFRSISACSLVEDCNYSVVLSLEFNGSLNFWKYCEDVKLKLILPIIIDSFYRNSNLPSRTHTNIDKQTVVAHREPHTMSSRSFTWNLIAVLKRPYNITSTNVELHESHNVNGMLGHTQAKDSISFSIWCDN